MKQLLCLLCCISVAGKVTAQTVLNTDKLAVPQSAATRLIDASQTLTGTSGTPKAFALGLLQSFDNGNGWPQNYAAEITPYWLISPANRNFYNYVGLDSGRFKTSNWKTNPFAAAKFVSLSIAFANKNMSADSANGKQKVFSIGAHVTLLRAYRKNYAAGLSANLQRWIDLDKAVILRQYTDTSLLYRQYRQARLRGDTATMRSIRQQLDKKDQAAVSGTDQQFQHRVTADSLTVAIEKQLNEKPIFQWDVSTAYAAYGVGDSTWKAGRTAVWTSVGLNLPLNSRADKSQLNYLSVAMYMRYMYDAYTQHKKEVGPGNAIDLGGKIMFEFDPVSFGTEYVHRSYTGVTALKSQRFVGFINYRITKALYFSGTFGNDFGFNKARLFSALGINWGFGNEKVSF
ncbi:hypothetical protein CLV59_101381 [Chitinophaga dinghuensis]|uniref:DUF3078 domain-containing protein n=1 Tax=Chitinophaga dinghuensis TaxID=1539050 RepID=A0A327WE30_9BACT|nr:hypothetical protein [Chitinophaga dinghuensis]RAJ87620.1 hypothetical protein CLV59_101381 [Chitinophaga dinghuensis]